MNIATQVYNLTTPSLLSYDDEFHSSCTETEDDLCETQWNPPTNPTDSIVKEILVEADKWSVFKYCIGIEKSVFEQPAAARRTRRENPQWV
jgi:hypothetical protein